MKEVLVVGSVALDTVHTPGGDVEEALGGSASYFAIAASLYVPVRVVAVVGEDCPSAQRGLLGGRRIDLTGLQTAPGRTFRWEGVYSADMNERTTLRTELNVFESFHPVLPEAYRQSETVFLANIDPQLQEEVLDQLSAPTLVVLDTMNYWIQNRREELLRVLRRVQIVLLNEGEARLLTGADSILKAAEGIRMMGPQVVVVKRGEYGCIARTEKGWFGLPAVPLETLRDPTGAGDSFAGGMIGHLASVSSADEEAVRTSLAHGTAVASFAVEDFGVHGILRASDLALRSRLRTIHEMVRFRPE